MRSSWFSEARGGWEVLAAFSYSQNSPAFCPLPKKTHKKLFNRHGKHIRAITASSA